MAVQVSDASPPSQNDALDPRPERRMAALGLRLFAATSLSLMTVFIKLASDAGISTPEMMFWRQAFAIPVVLIFIFWTAGVAAFKTQHPGLHMTRSLMGLFAMALTFSSYIMLPLAEATTLGFTVPIFATILSALILKEPTGWHRWGAVIAGFIGVLIVIQPGDGHIPMLGVIVGLSSAFMIGCNSLLIRSMGKTESPATTVFYFSTISLVVMLPMLFIYGQAHDLTGWLYLLAIGTLGGIGQIALTSSLRMAPISVTVAMDYVTLLWSTLAGYWVWNHIPPATTWIGAPIIVASGLYIAWREHRLSLNRAKDMPL
jgi:drug/metabolite transporter (DMT)-like permease